MVLYSTWISEVSKYLVSIYLPQQKGTINEYKKLLYKKQYTYLKVLQLRYCGRDSIIQVRNRPYFHYGPFGRTRNKWRWYRHIKYHVDS